MSDGMNKVILLGNLGADPELRRTSDGSPVLSMRLATNESWLDKEKVVKERTDWHTVVLFGARAEALSKILLKGSCVLVEGGLRTTSYEKDGQKRWKTEVIARDVFLTPRRSLGSDAAVAKTGSRGVVGALSLGEGDEIPY